MRTKEHVHQTKVIKMVSVMITFNQPRFLEWLGSAGREPIDPMGGSLCYTRCQVAKLELGEIGPYFLRLALLPSPFFGGPFPRRWYRSSLSFAVKRSGSTQSLSPR